MDLPQALLAQVALFPRLVSENISLKSFKHFDVYRRFDILTFIKKVLFKDSGLLTLRK